NVQNPNMSHDDAAVFASQHLFDYTGSTTDFSANRVGNWMVYDVPGAVYNPTGSGSNGSATMTGAYLVNPDGKLNPNARLLYGAGSYDNYLLASPLRQEYSLTGSGGTQKVGYYPSLGSWEARSSISGSSLPRYNPRTNATGQVYDWLKVG